MWARPMKHSLGYPGSGYLKSLLGHAFTRGQSLENAALKVLCIMVTNKSGTLDLFLDVSRRFLYVKEISPLSMT